MTLAADEFIRRFLIHVLPPGFHRIRHYGLFANGARADNLARARQLLGALKATSRCPRRATPAAHTAMPMLRRPHDRYRDLRARLLPDPAGGFDGRNQDRHLMMPLTLDR